TWASVDEYVLAMLLKDSRSRSCAEDRPATSQRRRDLGISMCSPLLSQMARHGLTRSLSLLLGDDSGPHAPLQLGEQVGEVRPHVVVQLNLVRVGVHDPPGACRSAAAEGVADAAAC